MKRLIILTYIVVFFAACIPTIHPEEPLFFIEYKIQNNTRHVVQISLYLLGKRQNPLGTTLSYTQSFSREGFNRGEYWTENPGAFIEGLPFQTFFADSLVLVFDGKKRAISIYDSPVKTFSSIPTSTVNLLRHSSYTNMGKDGGWERFQYTITEADYERAEPCDPCD